MPKYDDPGIWMLLKDGERIKGLDGTIGPERRGDTIVSTEGGYHFVGRMDGNKAMSWTGSWVLGSTDGQYSYTVNRYTLYRRDGDTIKKLNGEVVARIEKYK